MYEFMYDIFGNGAGACRLISYLQALIVKGNQSMTRTGGMDLVY